MPKREDIKKILVIGAGPIVIGQAAEFDYSGAQALKALKEIGYEVVLVNSNPATIMTDPSMADVTYIEPITKASLTKIIIKERPDAILPTMGGQTALNAVLELDAANVLTKYNVELIGAKKQAIAKAEDRELFRQAMQKIGLLVPQSKIASSLAEALSIQKEFGFPTIIRPSFTLGGSGGGIAKTQDEFIEICTRGLNLSPTKELLIETSLIGWKEFELEVVRDKNDNCIVVCVIENIDPMGVHTGDSITVAPAQTLTDKEYQLLRDAAIKVLREIGVDTGGSNVQFALNPDNGTIMVIEMNPRVSRSSALASKATGFPIAKVAAKLAVGFTLDELKNEITGGATPASFEPALDYVVTKIPRFDFEKFKNCSTNLTTQMKSVGEVMAIGATFKESLNKALRSLEISLNGLDETKHSLTKADVIKKLSSFDAYQVLAIADAFRIGLSVDEIFKLTKVDKWFLQEINEIVTVENQVRKLKLNDLSEDYLRHLKQTGLSDARLAKLLNTDEETITQIRHGFNIFPSYKRVDSTAGEYPATTNYLYSTYDLVNEVKPSNNKKIIILGSGPNRIGQGIEFDYCCVHASFALAELGFETIMVNCNPETVSTDFDTSSRLYFEALCFEDVMEIINLEQPLGVIVQYGGQTPLKLAAKLAAANVPIIGTDQDAIDRAEDRERFNALIKKLNLKQPEHVIANSISEGLEKAKAIEFPVVVRPSYVLGGRAMEIVHTENELETYLSNALSVSHNNASVLIDKYLESAIEVDVDAVCDGETVIIAGVMEHIEQAGIHSGDSACSLPVHSLSKEILAKLEQTMIAIALELKVVGLINAQFAVLNNEIWVIEVNPRASRTIPFVSKATGVPWAKVGAKVMAGVKLAEQNIKITKKSDDYFAVKHAVFPFNKFIGSDPILGPEMRSTGEVMGVGLSFGEAFGKGLKAANVKIPSKGRVFLSVKDKDKTHIVQIAQQFHELNFKIIATEGTMKAILLAGIPCEKVNKVADGSPHVVDLISSQKVDYIVNTTEGAKAIADSHMIRATAVAYNVSHTTTIRGAYATLESLRHLDEMQVYSLQEIS